MIPILHHYALSPFGEKVRLALGLKTLHWASVEVPIWPPRPLLEPLVGTYRRTPVLQLGADIYCDTTLILQTLDRLQPSPALYPAGRRGEAMALSLWADAAGFLPAASLSTAIIGDGVPQEFLADRIAFMGHDFSRTASLATLPHNRQRLATLIGLHADMLSDGRPFLLGDTPCAADLAAYHPLWFIRTHGGAEAEALVPLAPLLPWMARIAAFGQGSHEVLTADAALAAARAATPLPVAGVAADDPCGLVEGMRVLVCSDSGHDVIGGTLVSADATEFVLRRHGDKTDTTHIHLPRQGYGAYPEP